MSDLAELESALARGNHRRAQTLLKSIQLESLDRKERDEFERLAGQVRLNPHATAIAVMVGVFLFSVSLKVLIG